MSVTIKSQREIELMRHAGKLLGQTLEQLEKAVKPGMSTWELNQIGEEIIRGYGCIPSFLNYNGYPASICISVNDEVVHGIPKKDFILEEGDIVRHLQPRLHVGIYIGSNIQFPELVRIDLVNTGLLVISC